jgi:hypothetical protein
VRRASDNAEQDIEFDIEGNLNTGALAGFCSGTDGFVKVWYDQSGNGNDAEQTTTSDQPKIYDATEGVLTDNEKPAMQSTSQNGIHSSDPILQAGTTDFYAFSVFSLNNNASFPSLWKVGAKSVFSNDNTAVSYFNDRFETARLQYNDVTGDPLASYATPLNLGQQYLRGDVYERNTNLEIFIDASSVASTTAKNSDFTLQVDDVYGLLEARFGSSGTKMQEHVIWLSDQSTNRTGIETNINDYYSIYTP